MKNIVLLTLIGLFVSFNAVCQKEDAFHARMRRDLSTNISQNVDLTLGYAPSTTANALKTNVSYSNIAFERFGLYTSFEKGLDSDYFTNTLGITASIVPKLYLWGGMDLFTQHGIINKGTGGRKEFGVGYAPIDKVLVRAGYSVSIGPTITAGIRIPVNLDKEIMVFDL